MINHQATYQKTSLGKSTLIDKSYKWSQRQSRIALIMLNGQVTLDQLLRQLNGLGCNAEIFEDLVNQGFIEPVGSKEHNGQSKLAATAQSAPASKSELKIINHIKSRMRGILAVTFISEADDLMRAILQCNSLQALHTQIDACQKTMDEKLKKRDANFFRGNVNEMFKFIDEEQSGRNHLIT